MSTEVKLEQRGSAYYISGIAPKAIKIPSQMYPVPGSVILIAAENTEPFPESQATEKVREIYDSINPGIGTCYTNTEKLMAALAAAGIEATSYVGWAFVGGGLPVHHSFAAIGKHLLDFNPNFALLDQSQYKNLTLEEAREQFTNAMLKLRERPNSEYTTFGKCSPRTLYFAAPCKPKDGLALFQNLMKTFPKHPSYLNVSKSTGASKTQAMMLKKQAGSL